jgi:nucleoside-diphosphate-sugar epimerase
MHIFLAGATGAIGRSLIPQAIERGHTVTGTARSAAKAAVVEELGATPVVVDGLDRDGVIAAVGAARPDAVVHEMTGLSGLADARHPEKTFAATNRLRTEGTDHLLDAARAAGVQRAVVQSFGGWFLGPGTARAFSEDDALDTEPPKRIRTSHAAMRYAERAALDFGGAALRYGGFYGPGTGMAPGAEQWEMVRARKFPVVGDGGGIWSFIHVDDAASATLAVLEQDATGLFHVTDDEPAPVREWLPYLARAIGAPKPRHVPRWVARLMGEHIVAMMCEAHGASNAKIKAQLGWEPRWPTWRDGFSALATPPAPATAVRG